MRERFPFSATKRLGLLHSDGSLTVYLPDVRIEQARQEAIDCDENQEDPALFTTIVSLRVEDIEALEVPSLKPKIAPCGSRIEAAILSHNFQLRKAADRRRVAVLRPPSEFATPLMVTTR
jgi:hypothetical protein